jgi:hypothetical protein
VRLFALRAGRDLLSGNIPDNNFYWKMSQPQGHSVAGRIRSGVNTILIQRVFIPHPTFLVFSGWAGGGVQEQSVRSLNILLTTTESILSITDPEVPNSIPGATRISEKQ